MSTLPIGASSIAIDLPANSYQQNVIEIQKRIDMQFRRVIREINQYAQQQGFFCKLALLSHSFSRKGGIPEGEEFKNLRSYSVSIINASDKEDERSVSTKPALLFLKTITPCPSDGLKEMAERGRLSTFEGEVFSYWHPKLSRELSFFQWNREKVMKTKKKLSKQFFKVIEHVRQYVLENDLDPIAINPENWPFEEEVKKELEFESLEKYYLWTRKTERRADPLGSITIVKSLKQFKDLVILGKDHHFQEIFNQNIKELKELVDKCLPISKRISRWIISGFQIEETDD